MVNREHQMKMSHKQLWLLTHPARWMKKYPWARSKFR